MNWYRSDKHPQQDKYARLELIRTNKGLIIELYWGSWEQITEFGMAKLLRRSEPLTDPEEVRNIARNYVRHAHLCKLKFSQNDLLDMKAFFDKNYPLK